MSWLVTGSYKNKLLLDEYTGAAAAYSLRDLSILRNAPVVRVRRSSDNTEADFTATQVSDGSLASWVGAGNNGFVRTWYDQSGNGINAVQETTSDQPQIIANGAILSRNSKASIDFGTTTQGRNLTITTANLAGTRPELFTVISIDNYDTSGTVYFGTTTGSMFWQHGPSTDHWTAGGAGAFATVSINNGVPRILNDYHTASSRAVDINGVSYSQATSTATVSAGSDTFVLGKWEGGITWDLDGAIQEFIVYSTIQTSSRAGITANINNHYAIY
jgi:hypothetical protein